MPEEKLLFRGKKKSLSDVHLVFKLPIDTNILKLWEVKRDDQVMMDVHYLFFSMNKNEGESYIMALYSLIPKFARKWKKKMENVIDYLCMYLFTYFPMNLELPN